MKRIVIIGAGSSMFTQGLVADLIRNKPGGHRWQIALCDTDPVVLADITRLVKKMIASLQDDSEVIASPDRCDLLPQADYVVSTIGVGGRRAWEQDVLIPRKYGVFQPVGDTAMPGGISRAMRMVPAMVDIVNDTRKLAPAARFFNYSNPMAVICRALAKTVDFPVTGLCIGTAGSEWYIADYMKYERSRVTTWAAGINHCTFIYDYRYDGQSVVEQIRERIEQDYRFGPAGGSLGRFQGQAGQGVTLTEPFAWEFFHKYGAYPAPGDRHISEFFVEYFPGGQYYGHQLGVDAYSFEKTIEQGDQIHQTIIDLARSDVPLPSDFFKNFHGEHEQLIEIIDSIERDARRPYYVNLPNQGAVSNLPDSAVVEMAAVASANGLIPLVQRHFPQTLASFTNRFLANIELVVDAALKGDRQLMEEAVISGGYLFDRTAVEKMVSELLLAHKNDLPQF